jgi:hypothetical protein
LVFGIGSTAGVTAVQTAPLAPPQSTNVAREVSDLMVKSNKECVVMEHPSVFGGYIAALNVPGAKLTVITARFKDTTAMAYKLYKKDCMGAYADLSAAIDALDRFVVDDIGGDGLVAVPKKDMPLDSITRDGKTTKFDGDVKLLKKQKIPVEDFAKSFATADEAYAELLRLLSGELKK